MPMTPKRQQLMTRMSQCTLLYSAAGCSREEGCVVASGQLGGANHRDARAATPLLRNISRTRESCNRNLLCRCSWTRHSSRGVASSAQRSRNLRTRVLLGTDSLHSCRPLFGLAGKYPVANDQPVAFLSRLSPELNNAYCPEL